MVILLESAGESLALRVLGFAIWKSVGRHIEPLQRDSVSRALEILNLNRMHTRC